MADELAEQIQSLNLSEKKTTKERDKIEIPDWLIGCESVFLWHTLVKRGLGADVVIQRTLEKVEELKLEEPDFTLQGFILYLKLVLAYYIFGDMEKAWETMGFVENMLETEFSSATPDQIYSKFKIAFGHVMAATKANLLALDGQEEKSLKIGNDIIPVKLMQKSDLAALNAMKARFFLYAGYEDSEDLAVEHSRKAMELDPDNHEWKYLLAKTLRQKRRDDRMSTEIPREELVLLEQACEGSTSPRYCVYLAQVYRECAHQAFKQYKDRPDFYNSNFNKSIMDMNQRALKLYKEALEKDSQSPSTLRRVGYGIMNLPRKVTNYSLALKCLEDSLALSNNPITLHMLGTYYHRYANDNKKAIEYFEKTVKTHSYPGLSDFIRVKYIEDPEGYDPSEDLLMGLTWEMKQKNRSYLLAQLGGWYFFMKKDFIKSLEYFNQVISEDPDSVNMKMFKSCFLRMFEPIDMYHYLANEALVLLKTSQELKHCADSSNSDEEEVSLLEHIGHIEDFMEKMLEIRPELADISTDPDLIDKLLKKSEENKNNFQRNQNRSNDRGGFRGRGRGHDGRGRGFPRRGGFSQDQSENRGRFSNRPAYNQRESGDQSESRGRFSMANQRDKNHSDAQTNWRQRSQGKDDGSTKETDNPNWRKK